MTNCPTNNKLFYTNIKVYIKINKIFKIINPKLTKLKYIYIFVLLTKPLDSITISIEDVSTF